jgi:hypothetical protein
MASGVKENKVTGKTLVCVNVPAVPAHFGHGSWELQALRSVSHINNKATAVKATGRCITAPLVRYTH